MKLNLKQCAVVAILCMLWFTLVRSADVPCAARAVANNSVLCVCTKDYCDTVTRDEPSEGKYVSYVSSEGGMRFNKSTGSLKCFEETSKYPTLTLDPEIKYQTITGFGGAVTDSAGLNWKNLTDSKLMQHLIDSYCGDSGIQYNMLRVPIGGTDFSTRAYAYNELPENDAALTNFTLAPEDYEYKIPMIKACMAAASAPIQIVSATWSPPAWMKTNNDFRGYSRLKQEYLQTYVDYHYKFIEKYAEEEIPIWGVSISNEPLHGTIGFNTINTLGWSLDYMAEVTRSMSSKFRNSAAYKDIKILALDDQRYTLPLYWTTLISIYPDLVDYFDGVALHWYYNRYVNASTITRVMRDYPDKFVISTEACTGAQPTDVLDVDLGSWSRAEEYFVDIMENLNHNVVGWIDWNLCLNTVGGPKWAGSGVDSPIIINAEAREFYKQPMFYAMGHFSKFVPRGSQRINVSVLGQTNIQHVAFLTPSNTVVVLLYNDGDKTRINIRLGDKEARIKVETKSFTTIEMLNQ
ncbi:unnamed protein product [Chrysodeixis includens]|uniref:Glucosylceramidase n=1 Tax=Chrysodeixis includens TaxID=689277 RepID=A0A9N8KXR1_CHRIL|nr:unnamed protein product [Chrysodeixis includens]